MLLYIYVELLMAIQKPCAVIPVWRVLINMCHSENKLVTKLSTHVKDVSTPIKDFL